MLQSVITDRKNIPASLWTYVDISYMNKTNQKHCIPNKQGLCLLGSGHKSYNLSEELRLPGSSSDKVLLCNIKANTLTEENTQHVNEETQTSKLSHIYSHRDTFHPQPHRDTCRSLSLKWPMVLWWDPQGVDEPEEMLLDSCRVLFLNVILCLSPCWTGFDPWLQVVQCLNTCCVHVLAWSDTVCETTAGERSHWTDRRESWLTVWKQETSFSLSFQMISQNLLIKRPICCVHSVFFTSQLKHLAVMWLEQKAPLKWRIFHRSLTEARLKLHKSWKQQGIIMPD